MGDINNRKIQLRENIDLDITHRIDSEKNNPITITKIDIGFLRAVLIKPMSY